MCTILSWGVYDTCVLDCLDVHPPQLGVYNTHVLDCFDVHPPQLGGI